MKTELISSFIEKEDNGGENKGKEQKKKKKKKNRWNNSSYKRIWDVNQVQKERNSQYRI